MDKEQPVFIIDSLIEMTQYRDRELMAKSLVKILLKILKAKKIELYAVRTADDPVVLNLLARLDTSRGPAKRQALSEELSGETSKGIIQCIKERKMIVPDMPGAAEHQVIFPLRDEKGKVVNLLITYGTENSPENQRLTERILQLYQNYFSLLEESQLDRLTGLLNRETFIGSINKIITGPHKETREEVYPQSQRRIFNKESFTYWLGLLDIDHFKQINDKYGHLYGDEVLILLVRLMQASFRKEDLLFRYGGEEFIVVLKVPDKESASIAFQRFRKTIESHEFPQVGQVTVSIGYVQITGKDLPLTVVSRADKALYYAKAHGRNCISCYEELVARGELPDNEREKEENSFDSFDNF